MAWLLDPNAWIKLLKPGQPGARNIADRLAALQDSDILLCSNDPMIAAICQAHELTLVSANISEFGRIPALRLEDWTKP